MISWLAAKTSLTSIKGAITDYSGQSSKAVVTNLFSLWETWAMTLASKSVTVSCRSVVTFSIYTKCPQTTQFGFLKLSFIAHVRGNYDMFDVSLILFINIYIEIKYFWKIIYNICTTRAIREHNSPKADLFSIIHFILRMLFKHFLKIVIQISPANF